LGKSILEDELSIKSSSFPDDKRPTRSSNRRKKDKTIKGWGTKLSYVKNIEIFSFCFLKTNNITATFLNFIPDRVPSSGRVYSPNIPAENLPIFATIVLIHDEQMIDAK
jgi:hypothetical protein